MIIRGLHRFRRHQTGSTATLEFLIIFPLILFFFFSTLELFWLGSRIAFLERGVDYAVREIRLSTGAAPDYDGVKEIICNTATLLNDCDNTLRLELIQVNPRAWDGTLPDPSCSDQPLDIDPPSALTVGDENDLMIMRACARMLPMLPLGLGLFFDTGADGRFPVYSINAFVQEPK